MTAPSRHVDVRAPRFTAGVSTVVLATAPLAGARRALPATPSADPA